MPNLTKTLKPQYENKKENAIPSQSSKIDQKKEYVNLAKIIEESKKIEVMVGGDCDAYYFINQTTFARCDCIQSII